MQQKFIVDIFILQPAMYFMEERIFFYTFLNVSEGRGREGKSKYFH